MNKVSLVELESTTIQIIDGDRGVNYPKKTEFSEQGYCLFLDSSNLTKNGFDFSSKTFISKEVNERMGKGSLQRGDLVMNTRGTIGNIGLYSDDIPFESIRINSGMVIIRGGTDYDTRFLYLFLRSKLFFSQTENLMSGSVQKQLPISVIKYVKLPKVDITYQQKIAAVLSALDAKIELNQRINAELESMAKTLYDYWFVQFDFPTTPSALSGTSPKSDMKTLDNNKNILSVLGEAGRGYKSAGGKMVWNEELKRNVPAGWDSTTIENVLSKEPAVKKIPSSEILPKGLIPVIDQSSDFIAGFTDDKDSLIKANEPRIIFGDHTRILKLINFDFARGADGTQVLLSNTNRLPQHLLYHTLLKIDLSNYGYARHFKFLKETRIILPDESVSKTFEDITKSYYNTIKHNIFENQVLTELRDWLLPMLMNGQVQVT